MSEEVQEKDNFILYIAIVTIAFVSVLLTVKSSEDDKFAPIKQQLEDESRQMNIRVISTEDYE